MVELLSSRESGTWNYAKVSSLLVCHTGWYIALVGNTAISLIRLIAGLNEWIDMK